MLGVLAGPIAGLIETVVKRIWPDANEAERLKIEALKTALSSELAVHAINMKEAEHPSIFVAGWRPFIGWTCGAGLAYEAIFRPLFSWLASMVGMPVPPPVNVEALYPILLGMLGVATQRTVEKMNNVGRSTWTWPWTKDKP